MAFKLYVTFILFVSLQLIIYVNADIKTLALLDNFAIKETHSIFFQLLKDRGHTVVFKLADDSSLTLFKYGELIYENLILFSPNVEEFGGRVDKESILEFIDSGGNVLVTSGIKSGVVLRELASECGVEIDTPGNTLIDHFHYEKSDSFNHTLVVLDSKNLLDSKVLVGERTEPILYQGGGLMVHESNPLVLPILKGYSTSYCFNPFQPTDSTINLIGKNSVLVAAVQTRNNQRIIFSGSLYMFSNDAFTAEKISKVGDKVYKNSGNQQLCESLSKWVFKETGVIRVKSINYKKEGENGTPSGFTVMDMAVFTMELEQKHGDNWIPYDADDVQLEFVRIDPFVRTFFPRVASGKYEVVFKIPDIYGVFKFMVDYRRIGYTNIFNNTQVSVRPLKHTEYERFIESAYPYYVSAFSMMFGVFILSFVLLHADVGSKTKKE